MNSKKSARVLGALAAATTFAIAALSAPGCNDSSSPSVDPDVDVPVVDSSVDTGETAAPDMSLHPRPSRNGLARLQHRLGHIVHLAADPNRLDLAGVGCVLASAAEAAANAGGPGSPPPYPPPGCMFVNGPSDWKTEAVNGGVVHSYDFAGGAGGGTYVLGRGHISIVPPTVALSNIEGKKDRMGEGFDTTDTASFSLADAHIEGSLTASGVTRAASSKELLELRRTLSRVAVDVSYRLDHTSVDGGSTDDAGSDAGADPRFCITSGTITIEGLSRSWGADASMYNGTLTEEPYRVTFTWSDCDVFTCTYSLPQSSDKSEKQCAL